MDKFIKRCSVKVKMRGTLRRARLKKLDNKSVEEGLGVEGWVKNVKTSKRYKRPVIK